MKILKTSNENFNKEVIKEAVEVLGNGGVVLYPTDTVYGLGANIFNKKAVKKIYEIKHRSPVKPLSILVSNKQAISHVANLSFRDKKYIQQYLPGPYTLILEKTKIVPRYLTSGLSKVGVRIPDNGIARNLAKIFPITTTSANISDKNVLSRPEDIINQLGCEVDLVIDVGELNSGNASTIIDLTTSKPQVFKR